MRLVGVLIAITACSGSLQHVNRIALFTAEATIACDLGQTESAASSGWHNRYERNPIMGDKPSSGEVAAYMTGAALATALVWYVAPSWLRPFVAGSVAALEVRTIAVNVPTTAGLCGISGGTAH